MMKRYIGLLIMMLTQISGNCMGYMLVQHYDKKELNTSTVQTAKKHSDEIRAGETLTFQASWAAPEITGEGLAAFPMHGVAIAVVDKGDDSIVARGYLENGQFSFTAPRDDFTFRITLDSYFPGIFPDGNLDVTGNGIGRFSLVDVTTPASTFREVVEDELVYHAEDNAPMWSSFHAVADLVRQSRLRLNAVKSEGEPLEESQGFLIVFDAPETAYIPGNGQIHVRRDNGYDWDIIGREYAQALAVETGIIHPDAWLGRGLLVPNLYQAPEAPETGEQQVSGSISRFLRGTGDLAGDRTF